MFELPYAFILVADAEIDSANSITPIWKFLSRIRNLFGSYQQCAQRGYFCVCCQQNEWGAWQHCNKITWIWKQAPWILLGYCFWIRYLKYCFSWRRSCSNQDLAYLPVTVKGELMNALEGVWTPCEVCFVSDRSRVMCKKLQSCVGYKEKFVPAGIMYKIIWWRCELTWNIFSRVRGKTTWTHCQL